MNHRIAHCFKPDSTRRNFSVPLSKLTLVGGANHRHPVDRGPILNCFDKRPQPIFIKPEGRDVITGIASQRGG